MSFRALFILRGEVFTTYDNKTRTSGKVGEKIIDVEIRFSLNLV